MTQFINILEEIQQTISKIEDLPMERKQPILREIREKFLAVFDILIKD